MARQLWNNKVCVSILNQVIFVKYMISRGLRLLTKLIRISFCEKKPIGIPEEEWKNAKLFAVTGDYATTGNEDLFFNTLEQQLSLKLLQTKNDK